MSDSTVRHVFQATLEEIGEGVAQPNTPGAAFRSLMQGPGSEAGIKMNLPVELLRRLGPHLYTRVEVEIIIRPQSGSSETPSE